MPCSSLFLHGRFRLAELARLDEERRRSRGTGHKIAASPFAELERSLIVERVKAGMRRAKLKGRHIGRAPLDVDRSAIVRDRLSCMSLTMVAKRHRVSRATVVRLVKEAKRFQAAVAA